MYAVPLFISDPASELHGHTVGPQWANINADAQQKQIWARIGPIGNTRNPPAQSTYNRKRRGH